METERTVLVLGINGGVGGEVGRALLRRGWKVRALVRHKPAATHELARHIDWRLGNALNRQDVVDAAQGCSAIVHAVNPAKYHNWRGLALPMLDNTIAAAEITRARILFPGNVYNYGDDAFPVITEESPQSPRSRKGATRVEMEERLRDASWDGRIRALIVRAADFFGPRAQSSWFSQGIVASGRPVRFVMRPGKPHLLHGWAYLPDVAEAMVRLLDKEAVLPRFDVFNFRGHVLTIRDMMKTVCDVAGINERRVLPFPWWAVRASAPFVELFHEMIEMRYLWEIPVELDNSKLRKVIGTEPHTPLEHAIRTTLIGIGSLRDGCETTAIAME